jgi:hypothetical protein
LVLIRPLINVGPIVRPLRIEYAGAHYHVTSRGNERKAVFRDDTDREKSLELTGRESFLSNLLVFHFHATSSVDFFSPRYFLIARRLFCLLRLCEFFRASCFMLIFLLRGHKPALFVDGSSARRRPRLPCLAEDQILYLAASTTKCFLDPGDSLTLSPLDPLVSLWLLVPVACRFYFGPDIRSAHARIADKLCRGRCGSQAGQFVSLSGPDKSSIHTVRISQAFRICPYNSSLSLLRSGS